MRNRPLRPPSPGAVFLLLLVVVAPLSPGAVVAAAEITAPGQAVLPVDDLDRHSLLQAARRQADYLHRFPPGSSFSLGAQTISLELLRRSIASFIGIIEQESTPQAIARRVQEDFLLLPTGTGTTAGRNGGMLVTGYFQPVIAGSLERVPPFVHPLYRLPPDLLTAKCGTTPGIDRIGDGRVVPSWSRGEIETQGLLAGHELVYLADPIEAFILHIQGSGTIRLRDGSCRPVRFAGSNGRPYRSIGRLLVDEGRLSLEQATLPGIVAYLRAHPGQLQRILHANPRFIFFAWGESDAARGSSEIVLTAGRSVAVDPAVIPLGTVAFLTSRQPVVDRDARRPHWRVLDRFVFPQDSGAAIRGGSRVDLFLGEGEAARQAAGLMRERGTMYILVQKSADKRRQDD